MKIILIFLSIALISCKQDSASSLKSGTLQDAINSDSSITLNYRIDPKAISAHQSLLFINLLNSINFDKIPVEWDFPTLSKIKFAFNYLHSKSNELSIKRIELTSLPPYTKLNFFGDKEDFSIYVEKNVTELRWLSENNDVVSLKKISENLWEIQTSSNHFFWKINSKEICDSFECIKL